MSSLKVFCGRMFILIVSSSPNYTAIGVICAVKESTMVADHLIYDGSPQVQLSLPTRCNLWNYHRSEAPVVIACSHLLAGCRLFGGFLVNRLPHVQSLHFRMNIRTPKRIPLSHMRFRYVHEVLSKKKESTCRRSTARRQRNKGQHRNDKQKVFASGVKYCQTALVISYNQSSIEMLRLTLPFIWSIHLRSLILVAFVCLLATTSSSLFLPKYFLVSHYISKFRQVHNITCYLTESSKHYLF